MPLATAIKPAKSAVEDKATMVRNYAKDKAKKAAAYAKMNAQELQKFFAPSQRSSGTDETATDPNDGNINRAANYDGNGNRAADSNDGDDRTNQVAYSACIAVSPSYTYDVHCTKHSSRVDAIQNGHHLFEFCTPTNK